MSQVAPTGLPWQTKHGYDIEGRTTIIGNVDGETVDGTTHYSFDFVCATLDHMDDSQSQAIAEVNAEFIVRACNSHKALIEALLACRQALEGDWDRTREVEKSEAALKLAGAL